MSADANNPLTSSNFGTDIVVTGSYVVADTTPPVISPTVTGTPGTNGWYKSNVSVTWSVTDPESAITSTSGCGTSSVSTDTTGVTFTCTASSAGGTSSDSVTIKRDATAPSITATPSPVANANGWNNTDVTVSYACTDSTSGVNAGASSLGDDMLSSSGTASGSCVDNAGNSASASYTAQIDKVKPVITGSRLPAANANGWNNVDVAVSFSCSDSGGSGLDTNSVAGATVSTEGANQSVTNTGSCTDRAGNVADPATVSDINIDKTAPSASAGRTPAANGNGWNKTDVTVSFSGTDALSGIDSCTADVVLSSEGAGQSASGTCTDKAGNPSNTATASGINIDKTAPGISYTGQTPAANGNGWNKTDVTLGWSCSDALSGPVSATLSNTLTSEGAGQSSTGTCEDLAGNTASNTQSGINIDKTAPSISASRAPGANANGWNNTDVVASYSASDALSGLADLATGSFTFSAEGAGQSHTFTVTDLAGNSASATVSDVNIDKTNPLITFVSRTLANGFGWNNTDVTVNWSCSDSGSGVVSAAVSQTLTGEGAGQSATGTCLDLAGNSASNTQTGINIDKTKPTLSPSVTPNPVILNGSATASAGASDSLSGIASQSCDAPVTNSVGAKTLNCTATDKAGNSNSATASYSVIYAAGGFCLGSPGHAILQPINADGTSVFKQGSTVPAKFRVCDFNGNSIGTAGVVSSFRLVQIVSGTVVDVVDEAVDSTTPDLAFRWSATDQQWIYNISTKNSPFAKNKTYFFLITLNDGSTIQFQFGLK